MEIRLLGVLASLLSLLVLVTAAPSPQRPAMHLGVPASRWQNSNIIPNRYIVVYNNSFGAKALDLHQSKVMANIAAVNIGKRSADGRPLSTSVHPFRVGKWRGLSLDADMKTVHQMFKADEVAYIEPDMKVSIAALQIETNAPDALTRLSEAQPGGQNQYIFDSESGSGITVYILDTGVLLTHNEFGGRATFGANFVNETAVR
jgi:hypothetical protein